MGKLVGLLFAAVGCAVAYGITGSIDLPTPADVAIWAVAGLYSLVMVGFGATVDEAAR